ncbi:unnamed protein product, partial [Rotaria sp. Silwood2]
SARFIFDASSHQFDTPEKTYLLLSTSSSAWKALSGLWGESSARPISSKTITGNMSESFHFHN